MRLYIIIIEYNITLMIYKISHAEMHFFIILNALTVGTHVEDPLFLGSSQPYIRHIYRPSCYSHN